MIRANFHVDPHKLPEEEWAALFCEAVWLEGTRLMNQARMLAKLFSDDNNL